jgi:para-nitrobenzyl esterase
MLLVLMAVLSHSDRSLVHTSNGPVRGLLSSTYRSFRGIPFAAPPLGKLRWAPPAPPSAWGPATLDATSYKHNCMQNSSAHSFDPNQPRSTISEDCLYANVFTPANATTKLPVLFWVHGGGFRGGGSNESRLNGIFDAALAGDLVLVVANYRLGVFGFLGAQELRPRDAGRGGTGNYGILDQRAALRWVRDNIAAFGGDPARVLLVGESAGGASVMQHLVRNGSWGLFGRAAVHSGAGALIGAVPTATDMQQQFKMLMARTGCAGVPCLEALGCDALVNASAGLVLSPGVDGVDLTEQVSARWQAGTIAPGVPLIVGSVREDLGVSCAELGHGDSCTERGAMVCSGVPGATCTKDDFSRFATELAELFRQEAGAVVNTSELVRVYDTAEVALAGGNLSKWYWAARHAGSDAKEICAARHAAATLPHGGGGGAAKSYHYLFAHVPNQPSTDNYTRYLKGAYHSCDNPFIFHVLNASGPDAAHMCLHGEAEVRLSAAMVFYWRNFASTGDPNVHAPSDGGTDTPLPVWPAYDLRQQDTTMVFGRMNGTDGDGAPMPTVGIKRLQCDFWDAVAGW